jgi:hypothetical protein
MKVRTVTAGIHVHFSDMDLQIEEAGQLLKRSRESFNDNGIEVQTLRLSTQSWITYLINRSEEGLLSSIREVEKSARRQGIDFISVGPAITPSMIELVPRILRETTFVCTSAFLGDIVTGPLEDNIRAASGVIAEVSQISRDGSRNFMFASTASCPPDIPFFPAAYHGGGNPSFTIGMESGDIIARAVERTSSLAEFERFLGHLYDQELRNAEHVCEGLSEKSPFEFRGIDISFAPGLDKGSSIALSMEKLTGSPFGSNGTLSAAAAITRALSDVTVKRCGYNGLMLPILEDEGLAAAADLGSLDLQKLLLYSSVCGTGLDAIPIPGETSVERIASILRDVSYLSVKWDKPLSARLLPIPGRVSGEMTDLGSEYLLDCSILPLI